LPNHLFEFDAVGCNFDDNVGNILTSLITQSRNLKMVYFENNNFSQQMKITIKNAGKSVSNCTVII
jgi:hypothetical protein